MSTATSAAMGAKTIEALKQWFSVFPVPKCIQSNNGSHLIVTSVQDWVGNEGVKWVFYTPYYPQANSIVERTNGLIKKNIGTSPETEQVIGPGVFYL